MVTGANALDQCKACIDLRESFLLQGGAGSGKTESLKELLVYIKQSQPQARVVCITHTNAAVAEIISRIGDKYPVSTIHSFLYGLIGNYKKNIKTVLPELFCLPLMVEGRSSDYVSETEYKKEEFDKYKALYGKYSKKLYSLRKENCVKHPGKREYDKQSSIYNHALNENIEAINQEISSYITEQDYSKISYNETKFDGFRELSYGHDGLLAIFHLLFEKYPMLGKIISDRFDYLFIDEYQDTSAPVLKDFLQLSTDSKLTVCLFGDSMQSIYEDGISNIETYLASEKITSIPKGDNYRCSYEVIDFINPLRFDHIIQGVALKMLNNSTIEAETDRHGFARVLYSVVNNKPTTRSTPEEKEYLQHIINHLINEAKKAVPNSKVLILTNKAIAEKNGFKHLYKVFDDRYTDCKDRIENYLRSIQALDVSDLCRLFIKKEYNEIIRLVRKSGFIIHSISDKKRLYDIIQGIVDSGHLSVMEVIDIAVAQKLIKRSETCSNILDSNKNYLVQLHNDEKYQKFKTFFSSGKNTFSKIRDTGIVSSEEEFDDYYSQLKREVFITELFSLKMHFQEVLSYAKYIDEETEFITMHKTKGTSIPSVIVVMEEYFWEKYDFSLLYKPDPQKAEKRVQSQKLIYVACSRARNNLVCVRVINSNEVDQFKQMFPQAEEVPAIVDSL